MCKRTGMQTESVRVQRLCVCQRQRLIRFFLWRALCEFAQSAKLCLFAMLLTFPSVLRCAGTKAEFQRTRSEQQATASAQNAGKRTHLEFTSAKTQTQPASRSREKEREREERAAEEQRELEERERDLAGWAGKLRKEQEVRHSFLAVLFLAQLTPAPQTIISRIKERSRRKVALTDRKSAASQARMKSIASLAADDRVSKKRRKGGGGQHRRPPLDTSFTSSTDISYS